MCQQHCARDVSPPRATEGIMNRGTLKETPFAQYVPVMPRTRLLKSGRILFPATLCLSNEILREIWRPAASASPGVCELDRTEPNYTGRSLDIPLVDSSSSDTFFLYPPTTFSSFSFFSLPVRSSATWNVPRSLRTYTHFRNYERARPRISLCTAAEFLSRRRYLKRKPASPCFFISLFQIFVSLHISIYVIIISTFLRYHIKLCVSGSL